MNLSLLKNINYTVWYRGFKILKPINILDNKIEFSNGDTIRIEDNNIYLNKELICNDVINDLELLELYKYCLIKKGYKFLE